jgi:hypothetical protein
MAKEMPVGVKVISVLYWIAAVLSILGGLALILGGGAMASMIPTFGIIGGALFVVLGIIVLIVGIVEIFVALGLWKGQKWARIVAIIFAILAFIGAIMSIVGGSYAGGIIKLIIHGLIGAYLIVAKEVKDAF